MRRKDRKRVWLARLEAAWTRVQAGTPSRVECLVCGEIYTADRDHPCRPHGMRRNAG